MAHSKRETEDSLRVAYRVRTKSKLATRSDALPYTRKAASLTSLGLCMVPQQHYNTLLKPQFLTSTYLSSPESLSL